MQSDRRTADAAEIAGRWRRERLAQAVGNGRGMWLSPNSEWVGRSGRFGRHSAMSNFCRQGVMIEEALTCPELMCFVVVQMYLRLAQPAGANLS